MLDKDSFPLLCVLIVMAIIIITLVDIRHSQDVFCTHNHRTYILSLGKSWRAADKDVMCVK